MICVFDLIEHNDDDKARIHRLVDEECTSELSEEQIAMLEITL